MGNKFRIAQTKSKAIMLIMIISSSYNGSSGLLLLLVPLKSQSINFICTIY